MSILFAYNSENKTINTDKEEGSAIDYGIYQSFWWRLLN